MACPQCGTADPCMAHAPTSQHKNIQETNRKNRENLRKHLEERDKK